MEIFKPVRKPQINLDVGPLSDPLGLGAWSCKPQWESISYVHEFSRTGLWMPLWVSESRDDVLGMALICVPGFPSN